MHDQGYTPSCDWKLLMIVRGASIMQEPTIKKNLPLSVMMSTTVFCTTIIIAL